MVSFAKVLLTIINSLRIGWFFGTTGNQVSQTTDCLNKPCAEDLSQLLDCESVNRLYLKEFVFDEISAKQFSDTFSKLQHLTLDGCGINNELISILTLPFSLKSIRLERSNLTSKEIQSILDKLSPSLESLELIDCLVSKFSHQELQSDSTLPKESLDLSRFSHLRTISINNLGDNFDSFNLLLSLPMLPLENIKLSLVSLTKEEWTLLLNKWGFNLGIRPFLFNKWKRTDKVAFSKTLKEFDLEIDKIDENSFTQLINFLFSFPHLESIFLDSLHRVRNVSLPPVPSKIKQLSLIRFEIFTKDGVTSFWNSEKFSQLTHLSVYDSFKVFPYSLFGLNQLEYLKIYSRIDGDFSSVVERCCSKLQHLSIKSQYLIPLLPNFKSNFPAIKTLEIRWSDSDNLDFHLETIISSETLKCLQINYSENKKSVLNNIERELKSSIEELKLGEVYWEFVPRLLEPERFSCLKKIYIKTNNWDYNLVLNLEDVLTNLYPITKLTSLTLDGNFSLSNEKLSFKFEKLEFFCLNLSQETIDLDHLLSCMPNLTELQLKGEDLRELKLQNTINIRYLELPYNFFKNNGDYINVIKNTPNLIQLTTKEYDNSPIQSIPFAPELAYYFKELKKHFNDELQFEISPSSFPLKLLKNDAKLEKLVCLKSPELPNYLNEIFSIETFKSFVKQLFTIEIEEYFTAELIDYELMKKFFSLLSELKVNSKEDFSFVQKLLLKGENEFFTESTDFSLANFYKLFLNLLTNSIEAKLKSNHLKFINGFFKENKKYGPFKIFNFLKSFFTSLSIDNGESKIINNEIFTFFTKPLLNCSFNLLFDKIKENKLSKGEKEFLVFDYNTLVADLESFTTGQYEELCTRFKGSLIELSDGSFVESLFTVFRGILIPEMNCAICLDSLFTQECKFFKGKDGNCHLFHKDCLNGWLKGKNTCPHCKRTN